MSKQKQIDKSESSSTTKNKEQSATPPSWSELGDQLGSIPKVISTSGIILLVSALLPVGTLIPLAGVLLWMGYVDALSFKESIAIGGLTGFISAFFSSILLSFLTVGLYTVPSIILFALIATGIATIARKIKQR